MFTSSHTRLKGAGSTQGSSAGVVAGKQGGAASGVGCARRLSLSLSRAGGGASQAREGSACQQGAQVAHKLSLEGGAQQDAAVPQVWIVLNLR